MGLQTPAQIKDFGLPEVAFVGRSNVGKSSLINSLLFRKKLARTSHNPGRTQQINFFQVGSHFILADLPGYGFARVSKDMKAQWNTLISQYLTNSASLQCIAMLIDGRHGIKPNDQEMMDFLDQLGMVYYVVCTKMDKAKDRDQLKDTLITSLSKRPAAYPSPFFVSVKDEEGLMALRNILWQKLGNISS